MEVFVPLKVHDWGRFPSVRRLKREAIQYLDLLMTVDQWGDASRDRGYRARLVTTWVYTIVDLNWRILSMPGKSPSKNEQAKSWQGFVECRLSADQIESLMEWELNEEDIWTALIAEIMGGHKFTLSFNSQNETFVAALTASVPSPNAGYTLSSFAPDHNTAVRALAYKHLVVLECDWSRAKSQKMGGIG